MIKSKVDIIKIRQAIIKGTNNWQRILNICQNCIGLSYTIKDKVIYIQPKAEGMGFIELKFSNEECKLCQISEEIYNRSYRTLRLLLSNVWCILCPLYLLEHDHGYKFESKSICSHKDNESFMRFYWYSIKHNSIDGYHVAYATGMLHKLYSVLEQFKKYIKSNDDYCKLIDKGVRASDCIKKD